MRHLLLVTISVLLLACEEQSVQGYVKDPQESEVYERVRLFLRCTDPKAPWYLRLGETPFYFGPFSDEDQARKWGRAVLKTAPYPPGVKPGSSLLVETAIYIEDGSADQIWHDPQKLVRVLKDFAEHCAGD